MATSSTPLNQSQNEIQPTQVTSTPICTQSNYSFLNEDYNDDELDIDNLKSEQAKNDDILKFLLNYGTEKRKPGRPRFGEKNTKEIPSTVKESFRGITNVNDLHGGVLLDYLTKISKFNKTLINSLDHLNNKYSELLNKIDQVSKNPQVTVPSIPLSNEISPIVGGKLNIHEIQELYETNKNLQKKVDFLDQRSLSNTILCTGNVVNEILNSNETEKSKIEGISKEISSLVPEIKPQDIQNIYISGRVKKHFKITVNNSNVKNNILREARKRKLPDIYFNEYLKPLRSKLFFEIRKVKRQYPDKLKTTYTRNGNIYYKLMNNDDYGTINSFDDITRLSSSFTDTEENND